MASKKLTNHQYQKISRLYPKNNSAMFSKSEIIAGYRYFSGHHGLPKFSEKMVARLQMKPIRTSSGVVPVTLLTKPYLCSGQCIYCPNDPLMPKSYLAKEPGAQRAAQHQFDPYNQVASRLDTYYSIGHSTDKIELIILGGSWSSYPLTYRIWFIKRCFDALNDFKRGDQFNLSKRSDQSETATWQQLKKSQIKNETADSRCVGLSLETRPDLINKQEVINLRRLGCTKAQIGLQSFSNKVLKLNKRGHTIKESGQAIKLLRLAGFKIQAHWMANLYGSSPAQDIDDFKTMFSDYHYRPDELKIYPCSLIATARLMDYYREKKWRPYSQRQLLRVLISALLTVPQYCRVNRVIRDFSAEDIVVGSTTSNLRQVMEKEIEKKNQIIQEIRYREVRGRKIKLSDLSLKIINYQTSTGQEKFLQFVTPDNYIVGFLRLSLPEQKPFIAELDNTAIIREIHIYGPALKLGEQIANRPQHLGLGARLINQAKKIARRKDYLKLSVISAVGTREYYRQRGFKDGRLYQHLQLDNVQR